MGNRQPQQEMEEARRRQDEASQALIAASTTPKHHHLQEMEGDSDNEEDDSKLTNGDTSRDLMNYDDDVNDPVNERITLAERMRGCRVSSGALRRTWPTPGMIRPRPPWIRYTRRMSSRGGTSTRPSGR